MINFSKRWLFFLALGMIALLIIFILPNFFNQKEEQSFSDEIRIERARELFSPGQLRDSIRLVPGLFYERGTIHEWWLGKAYREIWQEEIKVPVLNLENFEGGLTPHEFSGNQQTIGMEATDAKGRIWSIRSINKDQSKALPSFLQPTVLRPMFRDQASALNPYGALVVPVLAEAAGIHHTNPRIFFFPYEESYGDYNRRMAGRLVLLEEEADESWNQSREFRHAKQLMDTEEMLKITQSKNIPLDTLLYAKSRLFDMLISDWDRHEGNWEWALVTKDQKEVIEPVPVDRDMAFYNFSKGALNQFVLIFNNKFQSFTPHFNSIEGLMHQSKDLDSSILSQISQEALVEQALSLQQQLDPKTIEQAFQQYPAGIYKAIGKDHERVLKKRLAQLPEVARKFYQLIRESNS